MTGPLLLQYDTVIHHYLVPNEICNYAAVSSIRTSKVIRLIYRFAGHVVFASDACSVEGNRNALSANVRKRVGRTLLPFPTDYDMILEGIDQMQDKFARHARSIDLYRHHDIPFATTY